MKVLDLFSGIGGFSLGLERAGMRTVAFCEIDKFCRRVIAKHWPGIPILDDVSTATFPDADVVVGGFPCQDISCAGKRAGLAGERSGLYRQLVRALRLVQPRYAIVENVAELLRNGMGTVLGDMAESGFDIEWDCVPARAIGAPHQRDRVWIIAHSHNQRCGEAGQLRHRSEQMSPRRIETWPAQAADAESIGWGQRRPGRPPDSFARIRVEARTDFADAASKGLERRNLPEAARGSQPEPPCSAFWPWPIRWPDEPPLQGMDDGVPDWVDRTRATGNTVIPQIVQIIGEAIMAYERERDQASPAAGLGR